MILRGIDAAAPQLGVSAGLSERAAALYPQTLTRCLRPARRRRRLRQRRAGGAAAARRRHGPDRRGARPAGGPRRAEDPHARADPAGRRRQRRCSRRSPTSSWPTTPRGVKKLTYKTYPGVDHGGVGHERQVRPATRRATSAAACAEMSREFAEANVFQRALRRFAASGPGSWLFARILDRLDRLTFRATKGKHLLSSMLSALPVAMVTTTGARSGQARTVPLLALPTDGRAGDHRLELRPAQAPGVAAQPAGEPGGRGRRRGPPLGVPRRRGRGRAPRADLAARRCAPTRASPATRAAPRRAASRSSSSSRRDGGVPSDA